jgi:hypothetical protein
VHVHIARQLSDGVESWRDSWLQECFFISQTLTYFIFSYAGQRGRAMDEVKERG